MEDVRAWALPRDAPGYHERQAARLRDLASAATTSPVKERLLREAEQHERMARGEPPLGVTDEE